MLRANLPAPKGKYAVLSDDVKLDSEPANRTRAHVPRYPYRAGWAPRDNDDFEDGGAYPELPVAQYPLGMGKPGTKSSALVSMDAKGKVHYDALARQGRGAGQIVQASLKDAQERKINSDEVAMPTRDEESESAERTRLALEAVMQSKVKKSGAESVASSQAGSEDTKYVRYSVNPNAPGYQASAAQRVIKVVEAQVDPMEPARHKIKKVPFRPDTDNVPVLHAPDKASQAEIAAFKIPPVISQWKNEGGFVIALDKRLASDGRGAQEVTINNKFATLSEALYVTEKKAAEDLRVRNAIRRQVALQEKADKDSDLRELAARARLGRAGLTGRPADAKGGAGAGVEEEYGNEGEGEVVHGHNAPNLRSARGVNNMPAWMTAGQREDISDPPTTSATGTPPDTPPDTPPLNDSREDHADYANIREESGPAEAEDDDDDGHGDDGGDAARQQREQLREQKRQQRMREQRGGRRTKEERDAGRDVSERVALGQHTGSGVGSGAGEAAYDSRLFNQSAGLDSGFGADDSYEAYTAPMFDRGDIGSGLYRPSRDESAKRGTADEQMAELRGLDRFRADKAFKGTEAGAATARPSGPRTEPVQFEKVESKSKTVRDAAQEDVFGIGDLVSNKRSKKGE